MWKSEVKFNKAPSLFFKKLLFNKKLFFLEKVLIMFFFLKNGKTEFNGVPAKHFFFLKKSSKVSTKLLFQITKLFFLSEKRGLKWSGVLISKSKVSPNFFLQKSSPNTAFIQEYKF